MWLIHFHFPISLPTSARPGPILPALRPPHLSLLTFTFSHLADAFIQSGSEVLRQEVYNLLEKGVIEKVPPSERESGFSCRYFMIPKRDGGLRPILDLRPINRALGKRPFRMLTVKQILAQIRPGDWFASVDLKDAYFHIQIAPHHRWFLRFAFEGTAYQDTVLPFGLALAPRTFSKCMDAALSPLRASGMRILNCLDDWLILAQSQDTFISHIDSLLIHLESLGLCVNMQKSILAPSQSKTHLGVCLDSVEMRARLSRERAAAILSSLRHFRQSSSVQLKDFQSSPVDGVDFGMFEHHGHPWLHRSSDAMVQPRSLQLGSSPGLGSITRGGHDRCIVSRLGSSVRGNASFGNVVGAAEPVAHKLEMEAVFLALKDFQPQLEQQHVLIRTDNTSVVSYRNHQGGIRSRALCNQATNLLLWADHHLLSIRAMHIPGLLNHGADMLSRKGIPQGVWRLHPESVGMIWNRYGRAEVDLFATNENAHCPLFFSLSHSPLEGDALTSHWPAARPYAFPPIKILPLVLCKIREEDCFVVITS